MINQAIETITTSEFYADIPAGTKGNMVKKWESNGKAWYKLRLGKTQDGTPIVQSFPEDVLEIETNKG